MKELVRGLQLTRLRRLLWTLLAACTLVAILCWVLFGWLKLLLLLAVCGLSYCSASYLYYNTEASKWRKQVDQWYEELFILALNYEHTPGPSLQPETQSSNLLTRQVQLPSASQDTSKRENSGRPQPSKMCHREAQKMIQLIMQHFVHTWYDGITSDIEFPEDVQKLLEHVALEVNTRLKQIDLEEIVCEVATLVLPYLQAVNEAGERDFNGVKVFDVTHKECVKEFESNANVEHRTLRSREQELRYYRQALDTLIQCAAPSEYSGCDPACMFVREILLANIIEPLLDLLCDPDFLYHSIPMVLSKASKEKVDRELADIQQENEKLEKQLSRGRLMVKIEGERRIRFHSLSSNRFGSSFNEGSPNMVGQSAFSRTSPKARPVSMAGIPSSMAVRRGSPRGWRIGERDRLEQAHESGESQTQSRSFPFYSQIQINQSSPDLQSMPVASQLPPDYTVKGFDVHDDHYADVGSEEVPSESDVVLVQLAPIYIERHVRVVGGSSASYTAYVFKFPKRMLSEVELKELNVSELDTHLEAMKRYSEFLSLHTKLLKSSSFARHIKGLVLPERGRVTSIVAKLPFATVDPDPAFLLERKQGLEKYLQSISSVKEIAESDQFHTFLKSGVQSLKEAHVISNPQKAKRRSFLGIVKTPAVEEVQKAEPIPKRPTETVLSGYLNTHLPLPCCSFHSIHTIRTQRQRLSHQPTETTQPLRSSLRAHSRVFGGSSDVNVASTSPTQSFGGSSVSTEDALDPPVMAANPGGDVETAVPPTSVEGTTPQTAIITTTSGFSSCSSGERSRGTTVDTNCNEETDKMSVTGKDNRTRAPSGVKVEASVRLRGNMARKASITGTNTHNQLSLKKAQLKSSDNTSIPAFVAKIRRLVSTLATFISLFISHVWYIVKRGCDPITRYSTFTIVKEQEKRVPLTNALFSLGTEVSSKHCPELWACSEDIQLALLVVVGGVSERYIWKELKEVVYTEENWARALYHLRHTLWPNGEVMQKGRQKLSEKERDKKKQVAAEAIKKFLPNFLPYIVGSEEYNAAVVHCLNCLANPRLNRHFILRIVEVLLMRLIPEIREDSFKVRLERLRTLKLTHGKSSISSLSAFHRRTTLQKSDTV